MVTLLPVTHAAAISVIHPWTIGCPLRYGLSDTGHRVDRVTEVPCSLMWPLAQHPVIPRVDNILAVVLAILMTRFWISLGLPTSFGLF